MSNSYYTHGTYPSTGSAASSAAMRSELDLVTAGFDKLPTLTGNANAFVLVNSTGTGLTATPTLADDLVLIANAADGTKKFNFSANGITSGATRTYTMPDASDTLVGRATTDTLANKTLTAPVIATIVNTGTLTLPTATDTLVGRATTDTLTNKTLTSPTISSINNGGAIAIPSGAGTFATIAGTQTLTGKTISGASNTLSNIANASLANSSVTVGTTAIALGATSLTLAGLTSVTVTADPTLALQLATKQYVDTQTTTGLSFHDPVQATTTGTLASITGGSVTYANGAAGVGATITLGVALTTLDGYTLLNTNRILVKNEAAAANNGVYTWATGGTVLTRATDADTYGTGASDIRQNSYFFTQNGTVNKGNSYVISTVGTITFGTTGITFGQFSGSTTYTASTGLTLTGTAFSIDATVATLTGAQTLTNKTLTSPTINSGALNGTVGATTPGTGAFTTLSASSTVSGTGFSTYLASPPAIGGTTAAAGSFTTLSASSITISGVAVPTISSISTLTNKRITSRVSATTSAASITPDVTSFDEYVLTAQAVGLAINAPTGTPVNGDKLLLRILDNATPQALTWNATYTVIGVTLPTTTTASKTLYVGCIYNAALTRWDVVAVATQA